MISTNSSIDCRGLSGVLTVLRVKQAVVDRKCDSPSLTVVVDQNCNCGQFDGVFGKDDCEVCFLNYGEGDVPAHIIDAMSSQTKSIHV